MLVWIVLPVLNGLASFTCNMPTACSANTTISRLKKNNVVKAIEGFAVVAGYETLGRCHVIV